MLLLATALCVCCQTAKPYGVHRWPQLEYDGVYYLYSAADDWWPASSLVLTHDGMALDPDPLRPEDPTLPGVYDPFGPDGQRYPFTAVNVSDDRVHFSTEMVHGTAFEFEGSFKAEVLEDFDEPIASIIGTLWISTSGKRIARHVKFTHSVDE
jgi:hypothetical protein